MDVDVGTSATDVQMMMRSNDADGTNRDRHHDDGTDNHDTTHHDGDGTNHDDVTNHDTTHHDDGTNHDDVTNHDDDGTNHDDVTNLDDDGDKVDKPFIYTGFDSEHVWFEWIPSLMTYIKRFRRKWLDEAEFILWSLEDLTVEGTTSGQRQCNSLKQDWAWPNPNLALMNSIAGAQQPRSCGWGRR
jgi:hypothetical protein